MRDEIGRWLLGTPLEDIARKAYSIVRPGDQIVRGFWQVRDVMKRTLTENSNCIDIGCFKGTMLLGILRYAPKGTHYAFEPSPPQYNDLRKKFSKYSNVTIYQTAISNKKGVVKYQIPKQM